MARDEGAGRPPVGLSALSVLFASMVAALTYGHADGVDVLCSVEIVRGENVNHALGVAFLGGLLGAALILCTRKCPRLLACSLLLGAAILGVALAFVFFDSASFQGSRSCLLGETTKVDQRVSYLYVLWAAPFVVLLWAALRSWRLRGAFVVRDEALRPWRWAKESRFQRPKPRLRDPSDLR